MQSIPDFHDGHLTGIRVREASATLYLRQAGGAEYELVLAGLEVLQADDFRQGNIIFALIVGRAPEHAELDRLFPPPDPDTAAEYREAHAHFLQRQKARIGSGEVSLLVVAPSYGADVLAICREVTCNPA
jgi:hypothetical protein